MSVVRRFVYRWKLPQGQGVEILGGASAYRTSAETTELPHYGLQFWRLRISWNRRA